MIDRDTLQIKEELFECRERLAKYERGVYVLNSCNDYSELNIPYDKINSLMHSLEVGIEELKTKIKTLKVQIK